MDATPRVTFASDAVTPIVDGSHHRSPSPTVSMTPSLLQPHTPTPRGPNGRPVPPKLSVASTAHHAEQPDGAGGRFVVHGNGQVDHDESDGGHQSTRRYARIVRRGGSSSRGSSVAPTPGPSSRSSSVFDPRYDVAASPEAAGALGGRKRIPAIALAPLSAMPQGYLSRSNLRSRSAGSSSHSKLAYGATPRSQLSSARSRSVASTGARTPRTFVYADDTARARQLAAGIPAARRREAVRAAHWVSSHLPLWLANACIAALVAVTWYAYDVVDALVSARAELGDMTRRALDAEDIVAHVRSQLPAPPAATTAAAAVGDSGVGEIIVWVCIAVAAVAVTAPSRKVSKGKLATTTLRRTHVYVGTGCTRDGIAADTAVDDPPTEPRLTSAEATVPAAAAAAGGDKASPKSMATRKLFVGRDGGDAKEPAQEEAAAGGGRDGIEHPSVLKTPTGRRTASGARRTDDDDYGTAVRGPAAAVPPLRTAREAVDDLLSHAPPADGSPSRTVARLSPRVQAMIAARRALDATPSPRSSSPAEPSSAAKLDMAASP